MKNQKIAQKGMKLGLEVGSLQNWMLSANSTLPVVGEGATMLKWSDRQAYQVIAVSDDFKKVAIQKLQHKLISGSAQDGSAEYEYVGLTGEPQELIYNEKKQQWGFIGKEINFIDNKVSILERAKLNRENPQWFDEHGWLKLIDGVSKVKKSFNRVNIIFGSAEHYSDPSF